MDTKGNQLPMDEFPNRTTPEEARVLLASIEATGRLRSKKRRDVDALRLKEDGYRQSWHDG